MYIFFDTETTGVPKDYNGKMSDLDNWPRIIQLAWQMADENGNVLQDRTFLVKPDGWVIPQEKFWIENGFTTQNNELHGTELPELLDQFITDYEQCQWLIAHNIGFDYPILGAEMLRYGKKATVKLNRFCTMLATVDYCKLPGKFGHKWPKLEELYRLVFGKGFAGAHDASNDVTACREAFFELKKRGIIVLPKV